MAEVKNAKKAGTPRKRKELKKVDKGQVHIQSTFNNTLVTITETRFRGPARVRSATRAAERVRLSRLRWRRKLRRKRRKNTDFAA